MTEVQAYELLDRVEMDRKPGAARILTLGRGDDFCVRILIPQWHCWSFADWDEFCKAQKKQDKQQRKVQAKAKRRERHYEEEDLLGSINPSEAYHLVMS